MAKRKKKCPTIKDFKTLQDLVDYTEDMILPMRQSSIHSFKSCPRKFLYTHRWFIYPKTPKQFNTALSRGTMVHKYLELSNESAFDEWVVDQSKEIRGVVEADAEMFGEANAIVDKHFQEAAMAKMIGQIYHKYIDYPSSIKVLGKEKRVLTKLDLNGYIMYLSGTVDEYLKDTNRNVIGIRDFKTTSKTAEEAYAGYTFGIQNRFYRLLLSEVIGITPSFFVLDILRLPTIRLSQEDRNFTTSTKVLKSGPNKGQIREVKKYIGEPVFNNYIERCKLWYANNSLDAVSSTTLYYNEPILTYEFEPYLLNTWNGHIQYATYEYFNRDLTCGCCKAYNRICPYMQLCQAGENMHKTIMDQLFEFKPPTQYLIRETVDGPEMDTSLYENAEDENKIDFINV